MLLPPPLYQVFFVYLCVCKIIQNRLNGSQLNLVEKMAEKMGQEGTQSILVHMKSQDIIAMKAQPSDCQCDTC